MHSVDRRGQYGRFNLTKISSSDNAMNVRSIEAWLRTELYGSVASYRADADPHKATQNHLCRAGVELARVDTMGLVVY